MSAVRTWPLPQEVFEYYGWSIEVLNVVRRLVPTDPALNGSSFDGMTVAERGQRLVEMRAELDGEVALALMASCEAVVRADFEARIKHRPRSTPKINRNFKDLQKRFQDRVKLDDILDAWRRHVGIRPTVFGTFGEFLRVRHWLAHGRRWSLKVARKVDPTDIKQAVDDLFSLLPNDFPYVVD